MSSPHHQPTPPPTIPDAPTSADDNNTDETLPLPLSASLVLTSLPQDSHMALEQAAQEAAGGGGKGGIPEKVTIRFSPVGSAPPLRQKVYKVSSHNKFSFIVSFLAKKLATTTTTTEKGDGGGVQKAEAGQQQQQPQMQVFCYVNSVFAPGLDEGLGGLWKCFKTDDTLIVAYSTTPAFG